MRLSLFFALCISLLTVGVLGQEKAARADYRQAAQAAIAGDFEKAEKLYRLSLTKLPANADTMLRARIIFNIGVSVYRMGNASDAIPYFENAISVSGGKYARAFYALGMALANKGELTRAVKAFERYLAIKPKDGEAWFDLGLAAFDAGDLGRAKEAFEMAYANGTVASSDALNNIGVVLAKEGDMPGAIAKFRAALRESGGQNAEAAANLETCQRGESVAELRIKPERK